ncbi:hypothetical protein GQ44DRAFT_766131 [Phaeosphaeriaceae sp. PMI808]|nr:hypothetical protein GQ44DRAFT_766131 [Phaeosphaeriaceae sp. PMI808]
MAESHADAMSVTQAGRTTIYTPSESSTAPFAHASTPTESSIPWPGSDFIIQHASTGKFLTLRNGQVTLEKADNYGAFRWTCVENKGWLGFRDPSSGRLLGYNEHGDIICSATAHNIWENMCVRQRPKGGYVLLMTHYESFWVAIWKELRPLGANIKNGSTNLRLWGDWSSEDIVWNFIEV